MEEYGIKKNKTRYYVFACSNCKNYSYVKTTQKTRKCLRCGRSHQIKDIASISEVIEGITAAKNRVIKLQDGLARKELGSNPDLNAENEFCFKIKSLRKNTYSKEAKIDMDFSATFRKVLIQLRAQYKSFPLFLIEMLAEDKGIPSGEVKIMVARFIKEGILKKNKEGLFIYHFH